MLIVWVFRFIYRVDWYVNANISEEYTAYRILLYELLQL
jgi:hypothetical protein